MMEDTADAVVIGGGPAGLMAAEVIAKGGAKVIVCDGKPSLGRKFLMAGKSGLNLTRTGDGDFLAAYTEAAPHLSEMIGAFGPQDVMVWAQEMRQPLFTGTTGRVFPQVMKASPMLRAWLARLADAGVQVRTRHLWQGWEDGALVFSTPDGPRRLHAPVSVLALGGASWPRLGSDGMWTEVLSRHGVRLAPFAPSNAALRVGWSSHMEAHFGQPLKSVALAAGPYNSRGEAILSQEGLEGGGIYAVSRGVREGHALSIDLVPDLSAEAIAAKLARVKGKPSQSARLRKALGFGPVKIALVNEYMRPMPQDFLHVAHALKSVSPNVAGVSGIENAISVAGGVRWDQVDPDLMLKAIPGTFCAGEMLDWEAPTGGYLLTACFASGRWAGQAALRRLQS